MILFLMQLQLLKVLWSIMAKRAKLTYIDPEEMLDVMQLSIEV